MPKLKRRRQASPSSSPAKAKKGTSKNVNVNVYANDAEKVTMPDPPPSLIKLLQKDNKVLEYFTSLQHNLNLDVKRWKDRALDYRDKYKDLQQQQPQEQQHVGDSGPKRNNQRQGNTGTRTRKGKSVNANENENDATKKKSKTSNKSSLPVQSVEVPMKNGNGNGNGNKSSSRVKNNDEAESHDHGHGRNKERRANQKMNKDESDESSLSDDSQLYKTSNVREYASSTQKKERGRDRGEKSTKTGEEGAASITEEDFFAELPRGDEESSDGGGSGNSSSSGSFGDIEAEFGRENTNTGVSKGRDDDNEVVGVDAEKSFGRSISEEERDEVRRKALDWLIVAFDDLQRIGVHVVDVKHRPQKVLSGEEEEHGTKAISDSEGDQTIARLKPDAGIAAAASTQQFDNIMDVDFDDFGDDDDSSSEGDGNVVAGFLSNRKFKSNEEKEIPVPETQSPTANLNTDENARQTKTRPVITRRSDIDVIKDIMLSLRSLIRRPTLELGSDNPMKVHFQPFLSKDLIPACYPLEPDDTSGGVGTDDGLPSHPLVAGLQSLERSLEILDTYTSKHSVFSDNNEWEHILAAGGKYMDGENDSDWEKLESIRIGLMNRDISSTILSSLEGEITQHWATLDRAARFGIKVAHPIQNEDDEGKSGSDFQEENVLSSVHSFNTKNRNKLFGLLERVCLANIVSSLFQHRGAIDGAAQVAMNYILSTAPSLPIEDYPRYAPVMSFCILEAMLRPKSPLENKAPAEGGSWFSNFLAVVNDGVDDSGTKADELHMQSLLKKTIGSVAVIWRQRSRAGDERLKGVSRAELAAYKRLVQSEKAWLSSTCSEDMYKNGNLVLQIDKVYESMHEMTLNPTGTMIDCNSQVRTCLSIQLILLMNGNLDTAMNYIDQTVQLLITGSKKELALDKYQYIALLLISCVATCTQLQQLKWEADCLTDLSMELVRGHIKDDVRIGKAIETLCHDNLKMSWRSMHMGELTKLILQCCILSGDGARAYQVVQSICNHRYSSSCRERRALVEVIAGFPIVRVINLKCREDRLKQFTTHARRSQLLAVLAVSPLLGKTPEPNSQELSFWGLHAHNGKDMGHLMFEQQIASSLQNGKNLTDYVATHWRPSDLSAFDVNARGDGNLVRTSVSERACALSHISSWIGVKNSILDNGVHSEDDHLRQLFRISGFASGPSFLAENKGMPPSPICVIFEDDAMLVDQFNDKLKTLLKELPRDFHFCSIGYR